MRFLFTYVLLAFSLCVFSQRIQNFNASLVNSQNQGASTQVLIRFTLTAGQACPGYEILHCTDSLNYIPVYDYAGICGNQNTDESFSFTHGSPAIEALNFYKVSIPGYETSKPYRIYVGQQSPRPNLFIFPNPVFNQDYITLRYENYNGAYVFGYIYNQFGIPVKPLELNINLSHSQVNISDLSDGLYIVWLTDGTWLFRNKFIVKRT